MAPADPDRPFIDAWRARYAAAERERVELAAAAREAARRAAAGLRGVGATRVWLFGSLLRSRAFDHRSDIDLATEGLPAGRLWDEDVRAIEDGARPFRLDVKALEALPEFLREGITAEGEVIA